MTLTQEEALEMVESDFGWYSLAKCVNDLVLVQCQLTKPELGCLNVAKTRYHKTLLVQVEAAQKALLDHRDIYLQAYDADYGKKSFREHMQVLLDADKRHAVMKEYGRCLEK